MPPELLVVPHRDESRRIDRWECAHLLDPWVRRLARQEALARRVLGRLAVRFLAIRGHHRLGFARLGDYTRERLGLGAREVQELARVTRRLAALPPVAHAFDAGVLSWAHLRLLTRVATPDDAAAWVARASGLTVRALEAQLRAAGQAAAVAATDEEAIDGEPVVHVRVACPRRVRVAWQEAVELARRMTGEEFAVWEAAEVIAAEGLSAAGAHPHYPDPPPDHRGPIGSGALDGTGNGAKATAAGSGSATTTVPRWLPVADAAPADLDAIAADCEALDAHALDARMRAALAAMARTDWQLGRLLRLVFDLRLERVLGFPSAAAYVRERLGCSTRKVRSLVLLERRGFVAPALHEAYRTGNLSWLRALLLLAVVHERTEAAWLARAREVTLRRLGDEVDWALAAGDRLTPVAPPPLDADLEIAPRQLCSPGEPAPCDHQVTFAGPTAVASLFRAAIAAFSRTAELPWQGLERLLRHVMAEWLGQPRHRDPVFARDGWRCAVPGCTSRRNLHDHHVVFRSRGGSNVRDNRITVCVWHHLHGIHAGRVRAWGRAPADVHWEVGVEAGRPPLLRTHADRYTVG